MRKRAEAAEAKLAEKEACSNGWEQNCKIAYAALDMVWDALIEIGPVGVLPNKETLINVNEEAEAVIEGLRKLVSDRDSLAAQVSAFKTAFENLLRRFEGPRNASLDHVALHAAHQFIDTLTPPPKEP